MLKRDYYPGGWIDTWSSQDITLECMAAFIRSDVIALRATVRAAKANHTLQWLAHGGMAIPQRGKPAVPQAITAKPGVVTFHDTLSYIDLVLPETFSAAHVLPNFNVDDPGSGPMKHFDQLSGLTPAAPGFLAYSESFALAPNRPVTVLFFLRLYESMQEEASIDLYRRFQQNPQAVAADAIAYWQQLPAKFPAAIASSHPHYKLAWRAFLTQIGRASCRERV